MSETPSRIGRDTVIDETTYIAPDVVVGDRCKFDAFVYVCAGVTIEDGVMVGRQRDVHERPLSAGGDARTRRARGAATSKTRRSDTLVREGATIGAGATIGSDLVIGRFAMIGMGSVVTRSVPGFRARRRQPGPLARLCLSLWHAGPSRRPWHRGCPTRAPVRRAAAATSATRPEDCASRSGDVLTTRAGRRRGDEHAVGAP